MKFLAFSKIGEEVPAQVSSVLSRNPRSTLQAAGEIAKSIENFRQAQACLDLTEKMLAKARERVSDYGFFQNRFGVRDESLRDIEQVSGWASKLRKELPQKDPVDPLTKKKIAVVLVQASKTFKLIDQYALEDYQTSYLDEYLKALMEILQAVNKKVILPALGATWQLWVPLVIVGGMILYAKSRSNQGSQTSP